MDSIPLHVFPYILVPAALVTLCLAFLLVAIETAFSSFILSEANFDAIKTLRPAVHERLMWLFNHPLATHSGLLFFRTLFFVFSVLAFVGVFANWGFGAVMAIVLLAVIAVGLVVVQRLSVTHNMAIVSRLSGLAAALVRLAPFCAPTADAADGATDAVRFSVDDFGHALEMQQNEEDKNMLNRVLHYGDETVADVMIPRVDMVEISIHADFEEVMRCVVENNYSRLPVRDGLQDKVKGILYAKDLLPHCHEGKDFAWQRLMRQPLFVPESKMIDDLLHEFRKNKIHIAVVVDEYGITSGIVTMEDILEEIVGEINDEYDEEEKSYVRLDENIYVFEGKTPLPEFFEVVGLPEEDFSAAAGEAETLAGFVLELVNELPVKHQKAQCRQLSFEVMALERRRISKIKVTIAKEPEAPRT